MKIDLNILEKFMSAYLADDFRKDCFEFSSIDISDDKSSLTAFVSLTDYAMAGDGKFHLSSITNSRIAGQLIIIYIFYCLETPKNREIYNVKESWKFSKPITRLTHIKYEIENTTTLEKSPGTFYNFSIKVEDGSFSGEMLCLKPK